MLRSSAWARCMFPFRFRRLWKTQLCRPNKLCSRPLANFVDGDERLKVRSQIAEVIALRPSPLQSDLSLLTSPKENSMALPTYGTMAVDWENRVDFDRLRRERLARAKGLLKKSEMGALLCFDMNNVRYLTATHIGTWAQDKANRFTLLPQNDEPILWDFGSAAKHHQLHCPWLGERSRAGISVLRGAMTPEMGRAEDVAKKIRIELEMRGLHKEPVGIDIIELPVLFALQKEGVNVIDGQALMSEVRVIKTRA